MNIQVFGTKKCNDTNQQVIKTPIVRNGKQATVGYQPDVWKKWE